jgi:hypothetical protein
MACFSPGQRWVYSYIDQRNGRTRKEVFVVIVVDECFGDLTSIAYAVCRSSKRDQFRRGDV